MPACCATNSDIPAMLPAFGNSPSISLVPADRSGRKRVRCAGSCLPALGSPGPHRASIQPEVTVVTIWMRRLAVQPVAWARRRHGPTAGSNGRRRRGKLGAWPKPDLAAHLAARPFTSAARCSLAKHGSVPPTRGRAAGHARAAVGLASGRRWRAVPRRRAAAVRGGGHQRDARAAGPWRGVMGGPWCSSG